MGGGIQNSLSARAPVLRIQRIVLPVELHHIDFPIGQLGGIRLARAERGERPAGRRSALCFDTLSDGERMLQTLGFDPIYDLRRGLIPLEVGLGASRVHCSQPRLGSIAAGTERGVETRTRGDRNRILLGALDFMVCCIHCAVYLRRESTSRYHER